MLKADRELVKMINDSIEDIADENGWAFLGDLGKFPFKEATKFRSKELWIRKTCSTYKELWPV